MKQREYILYAKKTKITTLFNNLSPSHQRCTILKSIRWMQTAYALLCQLHSVFLNNNTVYEQLLIGDFSLTSAGYINMPVDDNKSLYL